MAYEQECLDHGTKCPRIPFFSNPDIHYNGAPTGIPVGTNTSCQNGVTATLPCDANDALALNQTSSTVAGFREESWEMLDQPMPIAPENGAILTTYSPKFTWRQNPQASHYMIMAGLSPAGSGSAFMQQGKNVLLYEQYSATEICADNVCEVTPRMSNSDGRHYWSVWAGNGDGWSVWTDPIDFTLKSSVMKGAVDVEPLSPALDIVVPRHPTFVWNPTHGGPGIPDASEYRILVWDRIKSQTVYSTDWMPAASVCGVNGACQTTPNIALSGGRYLWRVKARGLYGEGQYNTRLYFKVK